MICQNENSVNERSNISHALNLDVLHAFKIYDSKTENPRHLEKAQTPWDNAYRIQDRACRRIRKSTREIRYHLECALVVGLLRKSEEAHAAIPCFLSHQQEESELGQQTVTSCISVDVFQKRKTMDKLSSLVTSLWSEAWHEMCWHWK